MASNFSPSPRSSLFLISAVVLASLLVTAAHGGGVGVGVVGERGHHLGWAGAARSRCEGSIAECLAEGGEGEFDLDSESNRRILATTKYISYGALQRNTVPCSRRGASYYNCQTGASSNPYSRGCSAITRCRG
ncbi:rapid alkalinization factor-like [Syzygium oleosum]|uniref:rapid alkalinization factor-like n=1 Tax=Syzygium oleosum TaxID=219896 RepID=UPI0011D2BAEC|nr:rapid alkalinization factor-like [Syzygium oleosum]